MKKEKTYLGKAPDLSKFSELCRFEYDGSIWVVFNRAMDDWQNLRIMLLSGRRRKANYCISWSLYRRDFSDSRDMKLLKEHDPKMETAIMESLEENLENWRKSERERKAKAKENQE